MKWSSAASDSASIGEAFSECVAATGEQLGDSTPDLVAAFISLHHAKAYKLLPELVRRDFGDCVFVGCSGGGVIGEGREVEHGPALAMTAARLPGVELVPFHVDGRGLPDGDAAPDRWETLVSTPASVGPHFLILADPWTMETERLLAGAVPDTTTSVGEGVTGSPPSPHFPGFP